MHAGFPIGFVVFVALYALAAWGGIRWARSRVNRRAREVVDALKRVGATVLAERPTRSIWRTAEADFELAGHNAKVTVRQWGRDSQLIGVTIPSVPMPLIYLRRERGFDRVAKSMGIEREVQLGAPEFDADVYISSSASDEVVREALASSETQRLVREIVGHSYGVAMSHDGLSAATLKFWRSDFDVSQLPRILELLHQLAPTLPRMSESSTARTRMAPPSIAIVAPAFASTLVPSLLIVPGIRDWIHPPLSDGSILLGLLLGLILWVPLVYFAVRRLRHRPLAIFEVPAVALALLASVPFIGAFGLFAVNSHFDQSTATRHHVYVQSYYRRNSHTVYVAPWGANGGRQKVIVSPSIPTVSIGDAYDVDTRPGALGWMWASSVTRSASP